MEEHRDVSDPLVPIGDGHTEVTAEERAELIPTWISTRGELYAAEEANIAGGTIGLAPSTPVLCLLVPASLPPRPLDPPPPLLDPMLFAVVLIDNPS